MKMSEKMPYVEGFSAEELFKRGEGITFDDFILYPGIITFDFDDINLETRLTREITLQRGLTSSPMDTVTEDEMAIALALEGGIGFIHRGTSRRVATAFETTPEECRNCGACQWICPVCERACTADNLVDGVCGGCQNLTPVETCLVCTRCSESVTPQGHKVY